MKVLLQRRAAVDRQDADGLTALHKAAANGHERVVQCLLHGKATPALRDIHGRTALDVASAESVRALLLPLTTDS